MLNFACVVGGRQFSTHLWTSEIYFYVYYDGTATIGSIGSKSGICCPVQTSFLRVDGCCYISVHVPTSLCCWKFFYFLKHWCLYVLRTLPLSLSLSLSHVPRLVGVVFDPVLLSWMGVVFGPLLDIWNLFLCLLRLLQQQSEPLIEELNMLATIRTIGRRAESVVGCKQVFFVSMDAVFFSVHVPTSFCCCE